MTASWQDPAMGRAYHNIFGGSEKHDAVPEPFEAGWRDAILESDWLAARDREVAARAWDEGAEIVLRVLGIESVDRYLENLAENGHANPYRSEH